MPKQRTYDAIIVGTGPNGLAAGIELARAGRSVLMFEAKETVGGGCRSAELTLPGFVHDVCSAIHPLGAGSPFFKELPLENFDLEWIYPPASLAHPFDDGTAAILERSIEATGETLGRDAKAYKRLVEPLARDWGVVAETVLGPIRPTLNPILHPFAHLRFGIGALRSARNLAWSHFRGARARAFFAGMAAHSMLPLESFISAAPGLVLCILGHTIGWPLPRGGSQKIADALAAYFCSLGGEIVTGVPVESLEQLPPARATLFDLTPRQLLKIAGNHLPARYRQQLKRYRYGPGVFKVDYALDGPIPWKAQECARAGTVHLGGTWEEIAASERAVHWGRHISRPYVLLAQQSLFDGTRAPEGKHTVWAYCHVPNGSTFDMSGRIEAQIERFAPGFRDRILARHVATPAGIERYNPNYIGGDVNGGLADFRQLFFRPTPSFVPYRTPARGIYLCSSSTPPSGGVHGMCGYYAAQAALHDGF